MLISFTMGMGRRETVNICPVVKRVEQWDSEVNYFSYLEFYSDRKLTLYAAFFVCLSGWF